MTPKNMKLKADVKETLKNQVRWRLDALEHIEMAITDENIEALAQHYHGVVLDEAKAMISLDDMTKSYSEGRLFT